MELVVFTSIIFHLCLTPQCLWKWDHCSGEMFLIHVSVALFNSTAERYPLSVNLSVDSVLWKELLCHDRLFSRTRMNLVNQQWAFHYVSYNFIFLDISYYMWDTVCILTVSGHDAPQPHWAHVRQTELRTGCWGGEYYRATHQRARRQLACHCLPDASDCWVHL